MIRERGVKNNTEDLYYVAMNIKEKRRYLKKDLIEEFAKYDEKKLMIKDK